MRAISLLGVDGSVWDLCDGPVRTSLSPALWGMPPVQITEQAGVSFPGSMVTHRRHGARDLIIPISVKPGTAELVEPTVQSLAEAVDPVAGGGDVTVTVTRPDGTQREIAGTYLGGIDQLAVRIARSNDVDGVLVLRAGDPYWSAVVDETVQIDPPPPIFTSGTTPFDDPATFSSGDMPFDGYSEGVAFSAADVLFSAPVLFDGGGSGSVLLTVVNAGDVAVWPRFRFVGPITVIEAANVTTGETWSIPDGLAGGEVLIVDTHPRTSRVAVGGVNAYGRLDDGSVLWALPPGESTLVLRADGVVDSSESSWTDDDDAAWTDDGGIDWSTDVTGGSSAVSLAWTPQWLTC